VPAEREAKVVEAHVLWNYATVQHRLPPVRRSPGMALLQARVPTGDAADLMNRPPAQHAHRACGAENSISLQIHDDRINAATALTGNGPSLAALNPVCYRIDTFLLHRSAGGSP
jgi:hypothetical protein